MLINAVMGGVTAIVARHRALAVLRILASDACNGSSNDHVLSDALDDLALGCARSKLRECLDHLARCNLVVLASIDDTTVVRLTFDGAEVAAGKARVEGVQPFFASNPY